MAQPAPDCSALADELLRAASWARHGDDHFSEMLRQTAVTAVAAGVRPADDQFTDPERIDVAVSAVLSAVVAVQQEDTSVAVVKLTDALLGIANSETLTWS